MAQPQKANLANVLLASGLDPSGGAGFVADVQMVAACGARPVGVITAHTMQNTQGVQAVVPVPAAVVQEALAVLLADVSIAAVKLGMLGTAEVGAAVFAEIVKMRLDSTGAPSAFAAPAAPLPVVWDPVLAPSRGVVALFAGDAVQLVHAAREAARVANLAIVLTPNLPEAARLLAMLQPELALHTDALPTETLASRLAMCTGFAVLVKGGHAAASGMSENRRDEIVDVLALPQALVAFGQQSADLASAAGVASAAESATPPSAFVTASSAPVAAAADRATAQRLHLATTQGDTAWGEPTCELHVFTHPRLSLPTDGVHGTGCALASALAAYLALGQPFATAVANATTAVIARMRAPQHAGHGAPSVW